MRSSIKRTVVAAIAALGMATAVASLPTPAQAQWHGGFRMGGGGFGWHGGGGFGGWHGGGWRGGPRFVGRPGFVGRPFFPARRVAFRRGFVGPFFGAGVLAASYGYSTCWTWVPTAFGWRRVWACGPGSAWGPGWGGGWGGWGW